MRLEGVRVLDLTRLLPGPYATQLLADVGADVVKVEDTGGGDYARHMPPMTDRGVGATFDAVNRGKRSVAIDLKNEDGRDAFYRLVGDADVVFEQFRPGVVERLGVDFDTVCKYNEDLVYCSLTGYGQNGPYAERAGHDLNYVGLAGLLDMTRNDTGDDPRIPGFQIGDLGGGLFAAFSIVGGLLARELGTVESQYIDVSMTDVVASFSQAVAHDALTGGNPRPGETALTGAFPWYDVYECADGRFVTLAALEPRFWEFFCDAVGRSDLIDEHMTQDSAARSALREELANIFQERSRDDWLDHLGDETMTAPVLTPRETFEHPQISARGLVERGDGAPPRVGFPARGTTIPDRDTGSVPGHGEHTDELLIEAGISDEELEALHASGAVK